MGFGFRALPSAWLCTAALLLGTAPGALAAATSGNDVPVFVAVTPPAPYHVERVGNQGIKLSSKNAENSYAITVLGSNREAAPARPGVGEAWQKSLGVEVQGKLGSLVKTDLTTRFTELEGGADVGPFGPRTGEGLGADKRALEEFSLSTTFLGDRVAITSSRRASNYAALDPALGGQGVSEQNKFNAWLWRSETSSLSVEGSSSRMDAGFQNLSQAMPAKNETSQQLKSKFSYGRAGVFVGQRETLALAPDRTTALSRQSDIETGASLGLSDLRNGGTILELLPDSVWVSTSHGSVGQGDTVSSQVRPLQKSAVGLTRSFDGGSVNLSYWRSQITAPVSVPDESHWRGHGMDIGGSLNSGRVSLSGNLSLYSADNAAMAANTAESNINGSLFLTWSRAAWPKLSAGVTNYAYQSTFFDYGGLEQTSLMRYEFAVDSTPLLSAWADPKAQLKFIASYQDDTYRSQWARTKDTGAGTQNVFFGFKFSRSLLP